MVNDLLGQPLFSHSGVGLERFIMKGPQSPQATVCENSASDSKPGGYHTHSSPSPFTQSLVLYPCVIYHSSKCGCLGHFPEVETCALAAMVSFAHLRTRRLARFLLPNVPGRGTTTQSLRIPFGGSYNKDYGILGLYWAAPILGNYHLSRLPCSKLSFLWSGSDLLKKIAAQSSRDFMLQNLAYKRRGSPKAWVTTRS